jgi:hypothetical protein
MKPPFPYFGGKAAIADEVWSRFGNTPNYVEPFAGSLAVLLSRPHPPGLETINDLDGFVVNFWRSLQFKPDEVVRHADWPVSEIDLHARHRWLVDRRVNVEQMLADPEWCDPQIAGWWVWGISLWIGSGWCSTHRVDRKRPNLGGNAGSTGVGIHRMLPAEYALDNNDDRLTATTRTEQLRAYLRRLAERLRNVRTVCGDWTRVTGRAVTTGHGVTAVFLDPPYNPAYRTGRLYSVETDVSSAVRRWAIEHGDDPLMRIALCGLKAEHDSFMPASWKRLRWRGNCGYRNNRKRSANREWEIVWFSPHCLRPDEPREMQLPLFSTHMTHM